MLTNLQHLVCLTSSAVTTGDAFILHIIAMAYLTVPTVRMKKNHVWRRKIELVCPRVFFFIINIYTHLAFLIIKNSLINTQVLYSLVR